MLSSLGEAWRESRVPRRGWVPLLILSAGSAFLARDPTRAWQAVAFLLAAFVALGIPWALGRNCARLARTYPLRVDQAGMTLGQRTFATLVWLRLLFPPVLVGSFLLYGLDTLATSFTADPVEDSAPSWLLLAPGAFLVAHCTMWGGVAWEFGSRIPYPKGAQVRLSWAVALWYLGGLLIQGMAILPAGKLQETSGFPLLKMSHSAFALFGLGLPAQAVFLGDQAWVPFTILHGVLATAAIPLAGWLASRIGTVVERWEWAPVMMVLTAASLVWVSFVFVNAIRARAHASMDPCPSNLKNIATALQMYSEDFGCYPDRLDRLRGDYLIVIPTCSSAGSDTYSASYRVSLDRSQYSVHCMGENHAAKGCPPGYPQYTSRQGLVDRGN